MTSILSTSTAFREGDEVVLAEGTLSGYSGVFLGLTDDVNWANIRERNGRIRCHPVAWMAHLNGTSKNDASGN